MYRATINNGKTGENEGSIIMAFEGESLEEVVKACEIVLQNAEGGEPYIFIQRTN